VPDASVEAGAPGVVSEAGALSGTAGVFGGEAGTRGDGAGGEAGTRGDGAGGEAGALGCAFYEGDDHAPVSCTASCNDVPVDFWDWRTCGGCDIQCKVGSEACTAGQCEAGSGICAGGRCTPELCATGSASCDQPGCGTDISTPDNCGGCGVAARPLAHSIALCTCYGQCPIGICAPGYANCDHTSNDCETAIEAGEACVPKGPTGWCQDSFAVDALGDVVRPGVALGADGTLFIFGNFGETHDFDPTAGSDVHVPVGSFDTFLTKFNADGSYAWTTTWASTLISNSPDGDVHAFTLGSLTVAPDGSVRFWGVFNGGSFDLDPSAGVDLHGDTDPRPKPAVVRLNADGSFAWARSWNDDVNLRQLAIDDSGRTYLAGSFFKQMDADPGPGTTNLAELPEPNADYLSDFLLSLDPDGNFRWAESTTHGTCASELTGIAVSGDHLWAVGTIGGNCQSRNVAPQIQLSGFRTTLFLRTDLDGVGDRWLSLAGQTGVNSFNLPNPQVSSVVFGSAGDIYITGSAGAAEVDFDPGPGKAMRTGRGLYVLSLAVDGGFRWVQAGSDMEGGLAAAANDGVLAAGSAKLVELASDGTPGFTFDLSHWRYRQVASNASGFVIVGEKKDTCVGGMALERYTW